MGYPLPVVCRHDLGLRGARCPAIPAPANTLHSRSGPGNNHNPWARDIPRFVDYAGPNTGNYSNTGVASVAYGYCEGS